MVLEVLDGTLSKGVLAVIVSWITWKIVGHLFSRSPLDNIPGPTNSSFLKGNVDRLFDRHGWDFQDEIGEKYGPVVKLMGPLGRKMLFVFDPKALHHIVVKDQFIYEQSGFTGTSIHATIGPGLFSTFGEHHRRQRKTLNPVFSINHMRRMTPIFYRVAHNLRGGLKKELDNRDGDVDVLRWMHRTALELIGQGGLGYSFDPLLEDRHDDYAAAMKEFLPALFNISVLRLVWYKFQPLLSALFPKYILRLMVDSLPIKRVQYMKQLSDTMYQNATSVLQLKKDALRAGDEVVIKQVGEGKDVISVLLRANMEASEEERMPEEELLAQMSVLVLAATDTTSNTLAQIMQTLATHPEAQEKLRTEILQARDEADGDISYDKLIALPYMDAVCRETLRLYPPSTFVSRETKKDVVMPLSQPIHGVDGQPIQEIPIPKDTSVVIGIRASNLNREIWGDDVREWKPERWLEPLPKTVTEAHIPGVYSNQMTFLGGGRSCLGFKFSQLEMKVVLSTLLESFRFSPSKVAKDVHWNLAAVRYPTIGKDSTNPQLLMSVELL
ncbi:unnamed protein product [Somion occarium]|uniref:Cytochrome P450 n=1 Tax=Somion occarium TaxID=3059160 RepID=A0ABP1CNV5_9APHY